MAFSERLAILISADTRGAVRELQALESTSRRALTTAEQSAGGFAASASKAGSAMIAFGANAVVGGAVASTALFSVAKDAAALGDAVQASDVIFGKELNRSIDDFARNAQDKLGLSRVAATQTLSQFAAFGTGAGLSGQGLLDFSESLTKVAVDIASLQGRTNEDVIGAIASGLAGEIEPLRRLGIIITDVGKRAEAVRLGIRQASDTSPLTAQQNVLATASLIQNSGIGQAASGDFERTIDSLPNRLKIAQASFDNLKASIGTGLIPVFAQIAEGATTVAKAFEALPGPLKEGLGTLLALGAVGSVATGGLSIIGGGIAKLTEGFGKIGQKVGGIGATVKGAGSSLSGLASTLVGGLNPATVAATAVIGGGLAIYEAWASSSGQVDEEIKALTASIAELANGAQVLPTLAGQFNSILDERGDGRETFEKTGLSIKEVTEAVNAAPGAFDAFRNRVDGLGGALEQLDGGLSGAFNRLFSGDVFQGDADAIADLRKEAEKAGPAVLDIVNQLIALGETDRLSGDDIRKVINYITDLGRGASASASNLARQARELQDNLSGQALLGENLANFNIATDTSAGVDRQVNALNALRQAFPQAAAAAGQATAASDQLAGSINGVTTAAASSATVVGSFADAMTRAATEIRGANEAISNADLFTQATQAAQGPARAALGYQSALLRVQQAQERLNQLNDPKKREEAIAAATERVTSAQESLTQALRRRRDAQEELDRLTRRSVVAGSVPLVQQIARAADEGVQAEQARAAQVRAQFGEGSNEDIAAQRAVEAAKVRQGDTQNLLNAALAEQGGRNQREIRNARENVADADRDIVKAQKGRRDAEKEYGDALKDGGASAAERKQAELDLAGAVLDAQVAYATLTGFIADGVDPAKMLGDALAAARDAGIITQDQFEQLTTSMQNLGDTAAAQLVWIKPLLELLGTAGMGIAQREGIPLAQTRPGLYPNTPVASQPPAGRQPSPGSQPSSTDTPPNFVPGIGLAAPPGFIQIGFRTYQAPNGQVWQYVGSEWVKVDVARPGSRPGGGGGSPRFFAEGGAVPGSGHADTVPAMLTPGEFVLTRQAVGTIGTDALKALNKGRAAVVQKFADGGMVRGPRPVPSLPRAASASARTGERAVEVSPTFNITSTEPRQTAAEVVRKLRRATFLGGVR